MTKYYLNLNVQVHVTIERHPVAGYVSRCPVLGLCATGDTEGAALSSIQQAVEEYLSVTQLDEDDIIEVELG